MCGGLAKQKPQRLLPAAPAGIMAAAADMSTILPASKSVAATMCRPLSALKSTRMGNFASRKSFISCARAIVEAGGKVEVPPARGLSPLWYSQAGQLIQRAKPFHNFAATYSLHMCSQETCSSAAARTASITFFRTPQKFSISLGAPYHLRQERYRSEQRI